MIQHTANRIEHEDGEGHAYLLSITGTINEGCGAYLHSRGWEAPVCDEINSMDWDGLAVEEVVTWNILPKVGLKVDLGDRAKELGKHLARTLTDGDKRHIEKQFLADFQTRLVTAD